MNIILVGPKYCGKTTIGKLFAEHFAYNFIDLDQLMLAETGSANISALHTLWGEEKFRETETQIIKQLNNANNINKLNKTVIATGGGVILKLENIALLQQLGQLVYLKITQEIFLQRLKLAPVKPAIIKNITAAKNYFRLRKKLYPPHANYILACKNNTAMEIITLLKNYGDQYGQ